MTKAGMNVIDLERTQHRVANDRPVPVKSRTPSHRLAKSFFVRTLSVLMCLLLWQAASAHRWNLIVNFQNIPAPTEVLGAFAQLVQSSKLLTHVWSSVVRIFVGFGIATILAVWLGLLVGRVRLAADVFMSPLEVLRPIPAVAWIPLAILMFPNSEESMIFITFVGAFFPILLNTIHGVSTIDKRLIFASLTLGASPFAMFREVIFPGALPSIVTGLSIGMGTSWFSLVTAEMISGQYGIGYYTWEAYTLQNYPDIVLGMISIGLLGMLSSILVRRIGNMFMPWLNRGETKV
jgi:NitT/TauT family transport system permease protein